jgi:hypothetical protein
MASQRVLTGYGNAFNEVPGTPAADLSSSYLWTWYDSVGSSGRNWVIVANPGTESIYYEVTIGDDDPGPDSSGTISPRGNVTPVFPGTRGGPLAVRAWTGPGKETPATMIASQRIIWGPSLEEVPGFDGDPVASSYIWSWYDQSNNVAANWVMITNPGTESVYYEVSIAGEDPGPGSSGTIQPGQSASPVFPGKIGGPVEVRAYRDATRAQPAAIVASQRVIWNGHLNEVLGTVLD